MEFTAGQAPAGSVSKVEAFAFPSTQTGIRGS